MKKLTLLGIILVMLVSAVASCGTKKGPEDKTTDSAYETDFSEKTEETTEELDEYGRPILKSSLPDNLDYNNEQINLMVRSYCKDRFIGSNEANAIAIEQALYLRNKTVESKLNVSLNYINNSQEGSDGTAIMGYRSGDGEVDIVLNYAYYTPQLAIAGCFANLNQIKMLDMSSIVWNQTFAEAVAYDGALYFNVGDFSLDYLRQHIAVFFNKNLANRYFGSVDMFYDMVQDGTWTLETAAAMLKDIHDDADGIQDADDFYGFMLGASSTPCDAMVTALGFNYTYKDSDNQYQLFRMDNDLSDKIDAIHRFISSEFCAPRSLWKWSTGSAMFQKQNVIFYVGTLDMADSFTNVDFDYGFLPLFKYDEAQEYYYTGVGDSYSLQCIMSNSPDLERSGAVLQCLNESSYASVTPEYFDLLLKGRIADSPEDAEMLDLIRNTATLDFGRVYSGVLDRVTGKVWGSFVNADSEYASAYSDYSGPIKELLANLQTTLKKMETQ